MIVSFRYNKQDERLKRVNESAYHIEQIQMTVLMNNRIYPNLRDRNNQVTNTTAKNVNQILNKNNNRRKKAFACKNLLDQSFQKSRWEMIDREFLHVHRLNYRSFYFHMFEHLLLAYQRMNRNHDVLVNVHHYDLILNAIYLRDQFDSLAVEQLQPT